MSGNRNTDGSFNNFGSNENSWSSSVSGANAWRRNLNVSNATVNRNTNGQANGFSVRCLKDWRPPLRLKKRAPDMIKCDPRLLEDLFTAYYDARKNKRRKPDVLEFEINYERNLFALHDEIAERRYEISQSVAFIVARPVRREIFAGAFRDRVVQHLLFNYLNPVYERLLINDCYSCRRGRGTMYGIRRLIYFIRSCSENYAEDCWILKFDIAGYFMSIDRKLLYQKVCETLWRHGGEISGDLNTIKYLLKKTIFHNPVKNCLIKGSKNDWLGLPKNKSLFGAGEGKGLPIGNITSQLFGNAYLLEFDNFIKRRLRCRYYGRYVDDCVVVSRSKTYLKEVLSAAKKYLSARFMLEIHPLKIYLQPGVRGVGFLGVFVKPWRVYIGNRAKGNFYQTIGKWRRRLPSGIITEEQAKKLVASLNSYLGLLGHWRTWRLRRHILTSLPGIFRRCLRTDGSYRAVRIIWPGSLRQFPSTRTADETASSLQGRTIFR